MLVVLVGVFQLEYPFLPRHTTLIAALTIGIPAFFLALAPNNERARPGFVRRVLRFAIPAGLVAGIEVFVAYWVARGETGTRWGRRRRLRWSSLFACSLYIVQMVARPMVWWKVVLIASMAGLFVLCVARAVRPALLRSALRPVVPVDHRLGDRRGGVCRCWRCCGAL